MSRYKKLKPIGEYIIDKEEMIEQVFASIPILEVRNMVPIKLQGMPLHELKAECMVELLAMSDREILDVLEGRKVRDAESSESGSETVFVISDEEKRVKKEKKDLKMSKVVLDDRSSAERSSSSRKKKKRRAKKEVEPKSKKKKREKDKEEILPSSSYNSKTSTATASGNKKSSTVEGKANKSIDDDVMILEEISSDEGEVVKEKVQEKSLLDLLELEMRARAIRSLLKKEDDKRAQKILSEYQDEPDDLIPVIEEYPKIEILSDSDDNEPKVDPSNICIEMHLDGNNLCSKDADVLDSLLGICDKTLANTVGKTASAVGGDTSPMHVVDEESITVGINVESGESIPTRVPSDCQPSKRDCVPGVPTDVRPATVKHDDLKSDLTTQNETPVESVAIKEEPLEDDALQMNTPVPQERTNFSNTSIKAEAPSTVVEVGVVSTEKNPELSRNQDLGPCRNVSSTNSKSSGIDVPVPKPISFTIKREPCSPERNEKVDDSSVIESQEVEFEESSQCKATDNEDTTIVEKGNCTPLDLTENSIARGDSSAPLLGCGGSYSVLAKEFPKKIKTVSDDTLLETKKMGECKSESIKSQETIISNSGGTPDDFSAHSISGANESISNNEDFPEKSSNDQCEETNTSESPKNDEPITATVNSAAKPTNSSSSFLGLYNGSPSKKGNKENFLGELSTEESVELGLGKSAGCRATPTPASDSGTQDDPITTTITRENVEANQLKNDSPFLGVSDGSPPRTEKIHEDEIFLGEPSTLGHEKPTHCKSARKEGTEILADVDPPDGPTDSPNEERGTVANQLKRGIHFLGVTEGSVETDVCDAKSPRTTSCHVVEIPSFAEPSVNKLISTLPTTCHDSCTANDDMTICSQFDDDALDYDDGYISLIPDDQTSLATEPVKLQNDNEKTSLVSIERRDDWEEYRPSCRMKEMNQSNCEPSRAIAPEAANEHSCSTESEAASTDCDVPEDLIATGAGDEIPPSGSNNDSNHSRPACDTKSLSTLQENNSTDSDPFDRQSETFCSIDPRCKPASVSENDSLSACAFENVIEDKEPSKSSVRQNFRESSCTNRLENRPTTELIFEDEKSGYQMVFEISKEIRNCSPDKECEPVNPDGKIVPVVHDNNMIKCIDLISEDGDDIDGGLDALSEFAGVSIIDQSEKVIEASASIVKTPLCHAKSKSSCFHQTNEQCHSFIDLSSDEENVVEDVTYANATGSLKQSRRETVIDLAGYKGEQGAKNQGELGLGCIDLVSNDEDLSHTKKVPLYGTEGGTKSTIKGINEAYSSNVVCFVCKEDGERSGVLEEKNKNFGSELIVSLPEDPLRDSTNSFAGSIPECQQVFEADESYGCISLMSDEDDESHPKLCELIFLDDTPRSSPVPAPDQQQIMIIQSDSNQRFSPPHGMNDATPKIAEPELVSVVGRNTATTDFPGMRNECNNCINLMSDDEEESLPNICQLKHPEDSLTNKNQSHSDQQFSLQHDIEDKTPRLTEVVSKKTETADVPVLRNESNNCINLTSDDEEESHPSFSKSKQRDDDLLVKPHSNFDEQLLPQLIMKDATTKLPELVGWKAVTPVVLIVRNESNCVDLMSDEEESHPNVCRLKHPDNSTNFDLPNLGQQFSPQNGLTDTNSSLLEQKGEETASKDMLKVSNESSNCIDLMSDEELLDKIEVENTVQSACILRSHCKTEDSGQNLEPLGAATSVNQLKDAPEDDLTSNHDLQSENSKVTEEFEELEEGEIVDDDSDVVPEHVFSLSESDSCSSRSSYRYCSTCGKSSSDTSISSYESYRRSRRQKNAERVIARKTQHRKPRSWRDRRRRRSSCKEAWPKHSDPTPQKKEIQIKPLVQKLQPVLNENQQPTDSEISKFQGDNSKKLCSLLNPAQPAAETITIEDDDDVEPGPFKEVPMEVVDLDEDDIQKSNWTARWLDSSHVKKALQTSKILANARKKLKLKLKSKNEEEPVEKELPNPSEPLQLIGSVEEYRQLVKDGKIICSSTASVMDPDPTTGDHTIDNSCDTPNDTVELASESHQTPEVSIQQTKEGEKEQQKGRINPSLENDSNHGEPILQCEQSLPNVQFENCPNPPQQSSSATIDAKNKLVSDQTNRQFDSLSVCHTDSDANIIIPTDLPKKMSDINNEDVRSESNHMSFSANANSQTVPCDSSKKVFGSEDEQPLADESKNSTKAAVESSKKDISSEDSASNQALPECPVVVNSTVQDSDSSLLEEKKGTTESAVSQEGKKYSSNNSTLALLQTLHLPFKPEDIQKLVASGSNCVLVLAPSSSKESDSPAPTVVTVAKIGETPLEQPPCPLPLFSLLDGKGALLLENTESSGCAMGLQDQSSTQPSTDGAPTTLQATSASSSHTNLENKRGSVNSGAASNYSIVTQDIPSITAPTTSGSSVTGIANVSSPLAQPALNTALNQLNQSPSNLYSTFTNPMQGPAQSSNNIQQYQAAQSGVYAQAQAAVSFNSSQQTYDAYQSWLASQGYQGTTNTNYGYGVDNAVPQSPMVYKQWEEYYRKMMEACQAGAARASAQPMFCPPSSLAEEQAKKSYSWVFEHPQHGATPSQATADTKILVTTPEIAEGKSPPAAAALQRTRGGCPRRGRGRSHGRVRRCRIGLSSSLKESFVASAHLSCVSKPGNW